MKYTAGFIGAGNMGGALLSAVANQIGGENTAVFDINENQRQTISQKTGASILPLEQLVSECKFIFFTKKEEPHLTAKPFTCLT